jgi:hypothetical protein
MQTIALKNWSEDIQNRPKILEFIGHVEHSINNIDLFDEQSEYLNLFLINIIYYTSFQLSAFEPSFIILSTTLCC